MAIKLKENGLPKYFNVCYTCGDPSSDTLERKQYERGRSDGKMGFSPSLLRGPYMDGYIVGRSQ